MPDSVHPAWDAPGWLDEVRNWTAAAMDAAGIESDQTLVERQRRPWSVVFTIDSSRGRLFFKAVIDELRHEAALHQVLFGSHPDAVPPLVAADRDRGWLLMTDAGQPLRDSVRSVEDIGRVAEALVRMAQLQVSWLPNTQKLLDVGCMDRRLGSLPDAFARLIVDPGALSAGHAEGIGEEEAKRLTNLLPRVEALSLRLASWGPPPTLHHDDFHDANIYSQDRNYVFADWGEAGVGHPFFTPMIALRVLAWRFDLRPDSPLLAHLRDAYLEAWERFGTPVDLRRSFDLAQQLAPISRALTWHRVMSAIPADARGEEAAAAAGWLRTALSSLEPAGPGRARG